MREGVPEAERESMKFHDHGAFQGPCSAEKHAVLFTGIKIRKPIGNGEYRVEQEPWEDSMRRAIEFAVPVVEDEVLVMRCACCRMPLVKP